MKINGSGIKSKTKCDIVVEEILAAIVSGKYAKGEKLPPEQHFVEYFGVSRVTVREAFKRLNMMGVVSIYQGKGTFVEEVDLGMVMQPLLSMIIVNNLSISQIFDARCFVESGAAVLAARNATDEEIEDMEAMMEIMEVDVSRDDGVEFSKNDIVFHEMIGKCSRNHILLATYRMLEEVIEKYIVKKKLPTEIVYNSHAAHKQLVDAIKCRDERRARETMEKHIELTKNSLIQYFDGRENLDDLQN